MLKGIAIFTFALVGGTAVLGWMIVEFIQHVVERVIEVIVSL